VLALAERAADGPGPVEVVGWGELEDGALRAWRGFALERENPFTSPEWVEACVAGGAASDPLVLLARDDAGGYSGFLAVERSRIGPLRVLRLPGHRLADWYEPACSRAVERPFLEGCAGALAELDHSVLALDRWAGQVEPLARDGALRARPARPDDVLPFAELGSGGWEEYLAGRSRNFRSQLGRRRRKLERERELEFRLADAASFERDWETFRRLHGARWNALGEPGALAGEAGETHRAFAAAALERGWLRLWTMTAAGDPVGAWYGWRLGDRYAYQLSGFDPEMARAGVGVVLLAHTIEQAAGEGARTYDLMWGDEPYKERFATGRRTVGSPLLTRPWSPAGLATRCQVGLRAAGRRLPRGLRRVVGR
jgi:CelD/BcsL family acetyltransferase involved in cellulose biosynthesis